MYGILDIGCKHASTCGARMDAIGFKKGGAVPEEIKIVRKVKTSDVAGRFEPGVEH